jgi:hypothetical protein
MRDFIFVIGVGIVITIFVMVVAIPPAYFLENHICNKKGEAYEFEAKYGFFEGCFVFHKGRWVELEKLRAIDL